MQLFYQMINAVREYRRFARIFDQLNTEKLSMPSVPTTSIQSS